MGENLDAADSPVVMAAVVAVASAAAHDAAPAIAAGAGGDDPTGLQDMGCDVAAVAAVVADTAAAGRG